MLFKQTLCNRCSGCGHIAVLELHRQCRCCARTCVSGGVVDCCSQLESAVSCCGITAESRIGDVRRRLRFAIFVLRLMMWRVACVVADAGVQELKVETLWTFSTRAAASGALQLSAWLDIILLRHHCRTKDWRYSQAVASMVCDFCFTVDDGACCVCCEGGRHALG